MMSDPLFPNSTPDAPDALYLDLLKRCLLNWIYAETEVDRLRGQTFDSAVRAEGKDWPPMAHTMIGLRRLNNVQECVEAALRDRVPGDLMETGVWRGGATILMRGILRAHGVKDRAVWVADSFAGLPPPNPGRYPHDAGLNLHLYPQLAVPISQVRENFARYGLLDDQVRFLPGWFRDTLPTAPVERLAVLRLDGDLYESTIDALTHLYPKVSPGGFVLVDDYNDIPACRQAVDDYRQAHRIRSPITAVDWTGVYWRRT